MQEILKKWNYIESDFQREYNINLVEQKITYRRFRTLVCGLSINSTFVNYLSSLNKNENGDAKNYYRYASPKVRKYNKKTETEIDKVWN